MPKSLNEKKLTELTPFEYIKYLRKKYGKGGKFDIPKEKILEFLKKIPESSREETKKIWMSRYDKSWGEIQDELMQQYLAQIRPIMNEEEIQASEETFFGIFPTCEFSGYAGYTPKGDRIVMLHEGLTYTMNFWGHWYTRCLIDENGVDYLLRDYLLRDEQELIKALESLVSMWYGRLNPLLPLPDIYPKTEDSWRLSEALTFSAIVFVLGHELGHVVKGHKQYSNDISDNHSKEFSADRVGLSICIRHALFMCSLVYPDDNYYAKLTLYGPLFALAVMSLFSDSDSDTHPSPSNRRKKLMDFYPSEFLNIVGKEKYNIILERIDSNIYNILDRNSINLFQQYSIYRELIDSHIEIPKDLDLSIVEAELEDFFH